MTFIPDKGLTDKQLEKELNRQAVLFEESCVQGQVATSNVKFADFAAEWMIHKRSELRPKTYATYESLLPRINAAIGHLRIDRITPQQLLTFYENLSEGGIRRDTKYHCIIDLDTYLKAHNLSKAELSRRGNVAESNILSVAKGNNCSRKTANGIIMGLKQPFGSVFIPVNINKPLSAKTVLHYHRLISSILGTAVEWGMIYSNPCERTKAPRVGRKEPRYLDEKQSAVLLDLLECESKLHRTIVRFLLFTGLRRGEALGLNWSDIDFDNATIQICRSSLYLPNMGVFEDSTKNETSNRVIKLPQSVITDLKIYRIYQCEKQLAVGDQWHESDRIFTTDNGLPLHPDTLSRWFAKFIKAHDEELPYISLHSLRHTNATLQIANGVPITTVSNRLGHADTTTTGKIYAHAIKSADEAAAETIENLLSPTQKAKAT